MFTDFKLEIELAEEGAKMPTRGHDTDAGIDVYSVETVTIEPGEDALISTGLKCKFPKGFGLMFIEKSGLATKQKLTLGARLVDSDYRGILFVNLFNNGPDSVYIRAGEKISQFTVTPMWSGQPEQVESVDKNTARGEGGFGSTGS
jgi:dUTP pyrophosphatase